MDFTRFCTDPCADPTTLPLCIGTAKGRHYISAYRTFGMSIDHHSSCDVLTVSFVHLRLHAECSVQHHISCDVLTVSFFHLRLHNVWYSTTFPVMFLPSLSSISTNRMFGTEQHFLQCSHRPFLSSPPTECLVQHHISCDVLTVSFFHLRLRAECSVQHHISCDVLTASFFHLRLQNVR